MTRQCELCGEYESENNTMLLDAEVCFDCVTMLVNQELDRRGNAYEARYSLCDTSKEMDALKDAGRYRG